MKTRIRTSYASMPFDHDGVHATGREVLTRVGDGSFTWLPEYEDDDTVDLPETDPPYDPDEE